MLRKILKRLLVGLSWLLVAAVVLPLVAGLLLQIGAVQTFVVQRLARQLSERIGTELTLNRVDIAFFNRLEVSGLCVKDPFRPADTLLYVQRVEAGIDGLDLFGGRVALGVVSLDDGVLHIARDTAGQETNLGYVIRRLRPDPPRPVRLRLTARELNLLGLRFTLRGAPDGGPGDGRSNQVNFSDLDIQGLYFQAREIALRDDSVALRLEHLNFDEKSGFRLRHLSAQQIAAGPGGIRVDRLRAETPLSVLHLRRADLGFDGGWAALNDFPHAVRIDLEASPSSVSYQTIARFLRRPAEIGAALSFDSLAVSGTVDDLAGRLRGARNGATRLDATFALRGLPDVARTRLRIGIDRLETDGDEIGRIYGEAAAGRPLKPGLVALLQRAGTIGFTGSFDGLVRDFTATGELTTAQGLVGGTLRFMPGEREGQTHFTGHLATEAFGLGTLLGQPRLGAVSLSAGVDVVTDGGELALATDATIDRLDFRDYAYHGIRMNGRWAGRIFRGRIESSDPNLDFTTEGRLDLRDPVPAYDFELALRRADLVALGFNRRDTLSRLAMRCRAHAAGTNLDDLNGHAEIDSLAYVNPLDTVHAGAIRFEARSSARSRRLSMRSDFADADLRGAAQYERFFRFFRHSLRRYLPSLSAPDTVARAASPAVAGPTAAADSAAAGTEGYYLLKIDVKQANNVAAIFVPGLEVAEGTSVGFLFDPARDEFNLSVRSDYILRRNLYVGDLTVECRNRGDSVSVYAFAEQFGIGPLDLPQMSVVGGVGHNRIALATRFENPENGNRALISTSTTIGRSAAGLPQLDVRFYPTSFRVEGREWFVQPGHLLVDSTGIGFRRFGVRSGDQRLSIEGRASAVESDTLRVRFDRLDLSPLTRLVQRQGYRIGGRMDGLAELVAPFGALQFGADLRIDSFAMNQHQLGTADFRSRWDGERRWVRFAADTPDGATPIAGYYDSRERRYRVDFDIPRFDMALLEPLLQGVLVDTRGRARTKLALTGGPEGGPLLNGTIGVDEYAATVAYTRARYTLSGPVTVTNNRFELPPSPLSDGDGGTGSISAWFDSRYFRQLRFGVKVDFRDLLCLNTALADNPDFYGRIYGTGAFSVTGDDYRTEIDVRAETARSSTFVLPLSEVSTIAEADFISFVEPPARTPVDRVEQFRRQLRRPRRRRTKSELSVDLNLTALPNTEAQIVLDPRLGDVIRGRGNGRFRMRIVPARDIFTMDGQYDITEGTYLFTLYGVLANKYFVIQPGGSIQWTGDPADPLVNIDAAYRVRTSLKPLLGANAQGSGTGSGNVNVSCGIHLTDRLFDPTIRLSVTAPGADPETKNLLRNLLNTEEATTMQFAYLMLSNSFMPDDQTNAIGTMSGSLAGIAGMEFLSNQISNLISGSNYNIRFGYRPSSELTSEEVTFDVGADLIANKLSLEVGGNYDVGQRGAYQVTNNPLSVDGYLTWVLNKSGSLKVKGFTRTIDRFDESQGLQDNGVGVYYRQEFQSWKDLQERYRRWRAAARERRAARQERRRQRRSASGTSESSAAPSVAPVAADSTTRR